MAYSSSYQHEMATKRRSGEGGYGSADEWDKWAAEGEDHGAFIYDVKEKARKLTDESLDLEITDAKKLSTKLENEKNRMRYTIDDPSHNVSPGERDREETEFKNLVDRTVKAFVRLQALEKAKNERVST